jgi:hypothetical protein
MDGCPVLKKLKPAYLLYSNRLLIQPCNAKSYMLLKDELPAGKHVRKSIRYGL